MIDRFHELLNLLSLELGIPLYPDKLGACTLKTVDDFEIQLEYDQTAERILIATFICEIPPGKLRENILKDALKANYPYPKDGILAYSERNNQLTLFFYLPLADLTSHALSEFLNAFIDKALSWRTGVDTGNTSQLTFQAPKSSSGMFGLK